MSNHNFCNYGESPEGSVEIVWMPENIVMIRMDIDQL
jgi:hypothetical protein